MIWCLVPFTFYNCLSDEFRSISPKVNIVLWNSLVLLLKDFILCF